MPWNMTYHTAKPAEPKIGDCWPAPEWRGRTRDGLSVLGSNYWAQWANNREPIVVALPCLYGDGSPGVDYFCIDSKATEGHDRGWSIHINSFLVDGQKPDITITSSINCVGSYHGYITNGVITDDCDGRKYGN